MLTDLDVIGVGNDAGLRDGVIMIRIAIKKLGDFRQRVAGNNCVGRTGLHIDVNDCVRHVGINALDYFPQLVLAVV